MQNFKLVKVLLVLAVMGFVTPIQAQYLRSAYFMEGSSARLQLNPGLQPTRGYFNIPVIGALNVSANSNTLGIQDIIDVIDDGNDIFSNNTLFNRLKLDNDLNVNLNTDILSFGWYKGKNFWSVNAGVRMDVGARLNKGMFEFMRNVNGFALENIAGQNQHYDMSNQKIRMNAYGEVGLGFSRRFTEKLTVGVKVKALLGLARAEMNINKFNVSMDLPEMPEYTSDYTQVELSPEDWMGKGYAYEANGNIVTTMKGGGITFDQNGMIEDFDFDEHDLGIAGGGFGMDFGFSYEITPNLIVSASVLDLGFLKWNKKETRMGSVEGSENVIIDGSNYDQYIGGDFLSLERFNFKEQQDVDYKSRTRLSSTAVAAAEYSILNKKLSFGAMYSAHFVQPKALHDITFSATYRPKNWFNAALSYSPILAGGKSLGVALKLGPIFLGTDYMYFGKNSKSVNGFLGLSIPLGSKRKAFTEL